MQNGESVTSNDGQEIQSKRDQVKQAGERIREHAKKCVRSCFQMGKELIAIRPLVDELFPKKWIKWSQKYTQGLSRSTVWRWMEVAENFPEADIADETKLIDLYRQLGLAKKKAPDPDKPDTTLVSPTATVPPLETQANEDKKDTSVEIGGQGSEGVTVSDEEDEEDVEDEDVTDDENEDDQEDGDEEKDDEVEYEDEQGVILGEALDLVHQMERLLHDSALLHSHVEPLKGLLIRLAADAELLAV
jgi:hypothetical protein